MQNTSLCAIKRYSIILTLILTVYIIPYQTEGKSCNEFKCPLSPLNTKLSKNNFNCSQKSSNPKTPKSSIFYVSSCPYATQECNFSPKNLNSVCEYPKSQFPGENCTSDQECLSGECNMRKCAGKSIGSACKSTGECDVHAFCNNSRCYPLAVLNEGCKIDGECDAFYVCINYKCLLLGAVVSGSVSATTTMACSTFYGVYNALGQLRCVEGPTLNGGYTDVYQASCNLGDLCRYSTTNLLLTDVCYCGANPNGNSYCQPGRGDLVQEIADVCIYIYIYIMYSFWHMYKGDNLNAIRITHFSAAMLSII